MVHVAPEWYESRGVVSRSILPRMPHGIALPGVLAALLALASAAASCGPPPHTAQHHQCRHYCQSEHDRCIVHATSGAALQTCDANVRGCLGSCPY